MPLAFGDFRLPTPGDFVQGTEALIGNVIEGVIEATTGQTVELTPGVGVNNSKVRGPRGAGEVSFDQKLASHDELEKLRQEVQSKLRDLNRDVTKLKVQAASDKRLAPPGMYRPMPSPFQPPVSSSSNNMLPLMLMMQPGGMDLTSNPAAMLMLAQSLSQSPLGYVGGQPLQLDLTTIALLVTMMGGMRKPAPVRVVTPAPAGDPT